MKAEIKERWIDALRSGEYDQGIDRLMTYDGEFCCLGVLCDLHSKETGINWEDQKYLHNTNHPPLTVLEWAGLTKKDMEICEKWNDLYRHSFNEIAALINEKL